MNTKKVERDKSINLEGTLFQISQIYLSMFAAVIVIASFVFWFHGCINQFLIPIALIVSVILIHFINNNNPKQTIISTIFSIVLLLVLTLLMTAIFDLSCDGNSYHKLAVGLLKNGWNPWTTVPDDKLTLAILGATNCLDIWVEAYCKATWIFGAGMYALTGDIETGKVYTLLAMISAFSLTVKYLKDKGKGRKFYIPFATLCALNPVAVQQCDSYYLDGFLHLYLFILIIALLMFYDSDSKISKQHAAYLIFVTMIVCGNIKFTGLLYGGIFCIIFYVWKCIVDFKDVKGKEWISLELVRGTKYVALAIFTIFVAGNTTYFTNIIRHKTFTYPLTGTDSVDIMTGNSPFTESNHFKNVLVSLFSKTDNFQYTSGKVPVLKVPFTLSFSEFKMSDIPDARIAGFGPFFGGLFIICFVALLIKLFRMQKDNKFLLILLLTIGCLSLTFGIKESWWARYAPYEYFIVLMGLYVLFETAENSKFSILVGLISLILLLNNTIALVGDISAFRDSKITRQTLNALSKNGSVNVNIPNSFYGACFNLHDYGIKYQLVNEPQDKNLGYIGITYDMDAK